MNHLYSGFWALFPLPNSFSQLSNASGCCPSRNSYCNVEHLEDDCEERVSTTVLWQFLFFVECPSISVMENGEVLLHRDKDRNLDTRIRCRQCLCGFHLSAF